MRIVLVLVLAGGACWGDDALGIWKMNLGRSAFAAERAPRNFTLRIERHAQGEVFTVERTEQDGRSSSDSTILFFDRKPRDYQDLDCRGTQSSQRVDNRTVEIQRTCEARRVDAGYSASETRTGADPGGQRSTARWTASPNAIGTENSKKEIHKWVKA
jgi:hypothetical protein